MYYKKITLPQEKNAREKKIKASISLLHLHPSHWLLDKLVRNIIMNTFILTISQDTNMREFWLNLNQFNVDTEVSPTTWLLFPRYRSESNNVKFFMWFMMMYELPWILKWTYNFVEDDGDSWGYIPQLERRIFNRWWDKFHLNHLKLSYF